MGTQSSGWRSGRALLLVLLAAAIVCMAYPYYVAHDTAQQENAILTFLTAETVYFLLRARHLGSFPHYVLAGTWLDLGILCKESLLAFLPFVAVWLMFPERKEDGEKSLTRLAAVFVAMALVLSPWLIRNTLIYGHPLMTTGEGNGPGYHL